MRNWRNVEFLNLLLLYVFFFKKVLTSSIGKWVFLCMYVCIRNTTLKVMMICQILLVFPKGMLCLLIFILCLCMPNFIIREPLEMPYRFWWTVRSFWRHLTGTLRFSKFFVSWNVKFYEYAKSNSPSTIRNNL